MKEDSEFLTVEQAADELRVHPETVRRLLRSGRIQGVKTWINQWRIYRASLEEFALNYRPGGGSE